MTRALFDPKDFAEKPPARARARNSPQSKAVMQRLETIGLDLARRFGLEYRSLEPERDGVHGHYGICYSDGVIRIRLRHAVSGRLLKESSLVDTLCHELAHLRHFDHSPRFRDLYLRILGTARQLGYYRPSPRGAVGKQHSLFGGLF